jgi:bacillithiol biosynthesis cysteine-adding enzyme BshC
MINSAKQISYEATSSFSKMVLDYVNGDEKLQPFYTHPVSINGIKAAIEQRKNFATDRKLLVEVLQKHYANQNTSVQQEHNIKLLANTNTFTVTTAHQPNIFTGHLYFIYKILHTIKLCETLKADMPENAFVPVFYMGSEDADLEELGHVYINGVKHEWNTKQTGAVGRMKVDKALIKILTNIEGEITVHPFGAEIIALMKTCYTEGTTIEQATFKLVNELFGQYGLLILLPDDADYKRAFIPVVEKELTETFSHSIVEATAADLSKSYKVQASGRELNMFYLKDDKRERIEKQDSPQGSAKFYKIQDSELEFDEAGIIEELKEYPERFSANVILRPVFQEMILPNIAFIGGGGEIAYWLELKNVFAAVGVPFPVLILRNSFLLVEKKYAEKLVALGFTINDLFKTEQDLLTELVKRESSVQLNLNKERETIHTFYAQLSNTVGAVDSTLQAHTEALEKLALRKIDALEKKMLRAEKKKFEAQQRQLHKLKNQLFPHNNLQERIENFMPFYAKWGSGFISFLFDNSLSLQQQFVVLEEL